MYYSELFAKPTIFSKFPVGENQNTWRKVMTRLRTTVFSHKMRWREMKSPWLDDHLIQPSPYLWKYFTNSFECSLCINRGEPTISFSALSVDETTWGIFGATTVWLASTSGISYEAASSKTHVINRSMIGRMSQTAWDVQRCGTMDNMETVLDRIWLSSFDDPEDELKGRYKTVKLTFCVRKYVNNSNNATSQPKACAIVLYLSGLLW